MSRPPYGRRRGERQGLPRVEHCGIGIASKWKYCPMCGKRKSIVTTHEVRWGE